MNKGQTLTNEALFLGFCVEIYKAEKKMSGQDAFNYLYRTGATDFLLDGYEALHTTGHLYIIDSIDAYIKNSSTNSSKAQT
ncbi:MAG: DUF3791 domain-containing protein [Acidobacteriota bacterium]|jgi:hypothetical protein|nr:DUF3791 domain-containing protein [Acidobacteriota bacterium]